MKANTHRMLKRRNIYPFLEIISSDYKFRESQFLAKVGTKTNPTVSITQRFRPSLIGKVHIFQSIAKPLTFLIIDD